MTVDTSTEAVTKLLDGVTQGPWVIDGISISHHTEPYGYPADVCLMGEPAQYPGDIPVMMHGWDANARFIAAARDLVPALLAERDALKAKCDAVLRHIPMDYLRRHDMPGASGPTSALQLDKAMQDYAEDRWKLIDRLKSLLAERDALKKERDEAIEGWHVIHPNITVQDAAKVPEIKALIESATIVDDSYWNSTDGVIRGIYELEVALHNITKGNA